MFSAKAEFYLVAERGNESYERRDAIIADFSLQQLPLAKVIGKRQGAVAKEVENVAENETVSVERDAT